MRVVDTTNGIVWLSPSEFALKQHKTGKTIRQWCRSGFVVELGFILYHDPKGYWQIGIPPTHQAYPQFA